MTNYNEKLDEILSEVNCWCYHENGCRIDDSQHEAKQAITSLIKELVAEAKPTYCDGSGRCSCSTQAEKYINSGKETAIIQFEQNLLKALEAV